MLVILSSKYLNLFTLFSIDMSILWSFLYHVLDTLWTKILMLHDFYDGPIRLVSKRHLMLNILATSRAQLSGRLVVGRVLRITIKKYFHLTVNKS